MKFNKLLLVSAIAASTALVGCGGDDKDDKKKKPKLPQQVVCNDKDVCTIQGILTEDLTMTADKTWAVASTLFVGEGNKELATVKEIADYQGPTLTIEAGTKIVGANGAAIVVTRGSQIMANGTASAPIIMSSTDAGYDGRGEWGGLVIQGKGITNKCVAGEICNVSGEGNSGFYGGADNSDSSGTINYVVVAEAGSVVGVDDELNGIGFMAVGSSTTVDFVQVHGNEDDGVEFWGGAVVAKHLVLTDNKDDSIDWDNGFVGGIQFAIVDHADDEGDHGMETDNNGKGMDLLPRSKPTISNVTLVGSGANSDTAIKHREGTGVLMYNTVVTGFEACLDVDDQATANLIDTDFIYTNVQFDCTADVKTDDEQASADFAKLVVDSTVSSVTSGSVTLVNGYNAALAAVTAPTIANSSITATTYVGAQKDAADTWYKGWTVGAISK